MKKCIAVLTRGYKDINSYNLLVNRNKHIESNLYDKINKAKYGNWKK